MTFKSFNYADRRDLVPRLRPVASWVKYTAHLMGQTNSEEPVISLSIDNLDELIFLPPEPNAAIHSFDSPTFSQTLKNSILKHINTKGIY